MLGLGASDLALKSSNPLDFNSSALVHRVQAVRLLNQAVAAPPKDRYEADARFATLMVLTFQTACMPEAWTDFFTMLRGCVLHGEQVDENGSCFISFMQSNHFATMEERFNEAQLEVMDPQSLDHATASLAALKPHCKPGIEQEYQELLSELIKEAYVSAKSCASQRRND
jgi:hypothetical protein